MSDKILYFEGAGWSGADISKATVGNCRIRTAFHLDDGQSVYLEIIGSERTKNSSPQIFLWQYTGFVDCCHYITDDDPNDDCNKHHVMLPKKRGMKRETVEKNARFEYTEAEILKFVNGLGASFDAVKVLPDLGGYRVFPEDHSCDGPDGYNYGDTFRYDPEMIARREAVYKAVYDLELKERREDRASGAGRIVHSPSGTDYPNFSLWVDEKDPGMLHLLRHFNSLNKHWTIRTDTGDTLDDWMATMTEAELGRCAC